MTALPRRAAVAGTFYPDDPQRLRTMLSELEIEARGLATVRPEPSSVVGLMVPHAGLVYSGAIAAMGWQLAATARPETIVIAGTDHQAWARGIGVWAGGPWRTPLGDVPVNEDLAADIARLGAPFSRDDGAHDGEHSIEVQLPLIRQLCPEAQIVPMAVSPRLRTHAHAGAALGRLLADRRAGGERILLVASSDMAHYPRAEICEATDEELLVPLLALDGDGLFALEGSVLSQDRPGVVCGLCGIDPVRVTLAAVREMGATHGVLLGSATSADAGGDPGRTVGYAAVAFV